MATSINTSVFEFEFIYIDEWGNETKRQQDVAQFFIEPLPAGVALEMANIPAGTAQIGSPKTEEKRSRDESEPHVVTLNTFFIGKFPITQAQWNAVCQLPKITCSLTLNPSKFQGSNRPVEQVSWLEAKEFCARVSALSGKLYRLPTEVEWEYACRSGTRTPFFMGETLTTDFANYCGENHCRKGRAKRSYPYAGSYGKGPTGIARNSTTNVGHFKVANALGLYDLHGNVWEWCDNNRLTESLLGTETIKQQPLRGGSWKSSPAACRSAFRLLSSPGAQRSIFGFRVVCSTNDKDADFGKSLAQSSISQSVLSDVKANNINIGNVTQIINVPDSTVVD